MPDVLHAAHSNREWQPIWYYIHAAGISVDEAIERLKAEPASQRSHRNGAVAQLNGARKAFNINAGKPKQLIEGFKAGVVTEPTTTRTLINLRSRFRAFRKRSMISPASGICCCSVMTERTMTPLRIKTCGAPYFAPLAAGRAVFNLKVEKNV